MQHSACYQFKRLHLQRYKGAQPHDAGKNTIRTGDVWGQNFQVDVFIRGGRAYFREDLLKLMVC